MPPDEPEPFMGRKRVRNPAEWKKNKILQVLFIFFPQKYLKIFSEFASLLFSFMVIKRIANFLPFIILPCY